MSYTGEGLNEFHGVFKRERERSGGIVCKHKDVLDVLELEKYSYIYVIEKPFEMESDPPGGLYQELLKSGWKTEIETQPDGVMLIVSYARIEVYNENNS